MTMKDNSGKVLLALLAGASAGVVAGLLMAPDTGEVTRDGIKKWAGKISKDLEKNLQTSLDEIKNRSNEMLSKMGGAKEGSTGTSGTASTGGATTNDSKGGGASGGQASVGTSTAGGTTGGTPAGSTGGSSGSAGGATTGTTGGTTTGGTTTGRGNV